MKLKITEGLHVYYRCISREIIMSWINNAIVLTMSNDLLTLRRNAISRLYIHSYSKLFFQSTVQYSALVPLMLCISLVYNYNKNKKTFINEQRSSDAAAKKS